MVSYEYKVVTTPLAGCVRVMCTNWQVKAADCYGFLSLVLSKAMYQKEARNPRKAIKPREVTMFMSLLNCYFN